MKEGLAGLKMALQTSITAVQLVKDEREVLGELGRVGDR